MIGLIMAGGKGSRMNMHDEKLLLKYKQPVILHVVKALQNSNCFSKIVAATSNNSPKTKKLLQENNIETVDTQGNACDKEARNDGKSIMCTTNLHYDLCIYIYM